MQRARAGVEHRGSRLRGGLQALAALTLLSGLLAGAGLSWGLRQWPQEVTALMGAGGEGAPGIPRWAAPTLTALVFFGTAVQVAVILTARGALGAVQRWTLDPGGRTHPDGTHTQELQRRLRAVRPWLGAGQWAPVFLAVLGWLPVALLSGTAASDGLGADGTGAGLMLLGALAQQGPGLVINALIFSALRRWVDALLTRSADPQFPVWPFARPLDPWLLLTLALLLLGGLSALLGGLGLLAFGSLWPALVAAAEGGSGLPDSELASITHALEVVFAPLGGLLVLSSVFDGLLAALMGWSRGFALDSATVLDAHLPALRPPSGEAPDEADWSGPERHVPPRDPRSGA